ncbi:histidine phosphatase family protein [Companilactobacillus keshanensis]|uniref:Histidine phosphatase family protein n=1 Tax=Companilactobacillus keshanensis TaxID=2486003 RepID=A0ABW4BV68_9LACO|nr:histidine phosphatase family protein [Companilactobacillus keshanensis]
MTEFYLVRHGQTTANATGIKQGSINNEMTHLTEVGKTQVEKLHKTFDISNLDQIISSPLFRTLETTNILNDGYNLPISTDKRLIEISYGQWDGLKNADLKAAYPELFDPYIQDVLPDYVQKATRGETFDGVADRIKEFLVETAQKFPDQKILLVTHGFSIKAAMLGLFHPDDPMMIPEPDNASVTKLIVLGKSRKYYLKYYNRQRA